MPRRPLADGHVERLCRVFRVPPERRTFFRRMLDGALNEAWRGYGINRGIPRSSNIVRVLSNARLLPPNEAAILLSGEHPDAEAAESLLVAAALPDGDLESWLTYSPADKVAAVYDRAIASARRHFRSRGRTPGTGGNPAFDLFVQELYGVVLAAGGNPGTASKKGSGDVFGAMFRQAIPSLRRAGQLPEDFVPATENSKLKVFEKARREFSNTRF